MYADLDFFIALIKDDDWLKKKAQNIYLDHNRDIWTSTIALQEFIMYAKREGLDIDDCIHKISDLIEIKETLLTVETCVAVTDLIKKYGMTTFDAFHAVIAGNDTIISSDKSYDKLGLKRIKLEE